jgi:hypothetical protein
LWLPPWRWRFPRRCFTSGAAGTNGVYATFNNPITTCNGAGTSKLITLPQTGAENDDHNPDRVKPRNVFNVFGVGPRDEVGAVQTDPFRHPGALFSPVSSPFRAARKLDSARSTPQLNPHAVKMRRLPIRERMNRP